MKAVHSNLAASAHKSGASGAQIHTRAVNPVSASGAFQTGNSFFRLQRTLGNRYAQRAVELASQAEGEMASEVESEIESARGGGQGLEQGVRRQMESAFGC